MDAGKGFSALPAGEPAALPALGIAQCGGAVSAAAQRGYALAQRIYRRRESLRLLARTRFLKTPRALPATIWL